MIIFARTTVSVCLWPFVRAFVYLTFGLHFSLLLVGVRLLLRTVVVVVPRSCNLFTHRREWCVNNGLRECITTWGPFFFSFFTLVRYYFRTRDGLA